jgi:hypothetical protein
MDLMLPTNLLGKNCEVLSQSSSSSSLPQLSQSSGVECRISLDNNYNSNNKNNRNIIPTQETTTQTVGSLSDYTINVFDLHEFNQRKEWFRYWLSNLTLLLFFLIYDVYNLSSLRQFYSLDRGEDIEDRTILIFYVMSLTFRTGNGLLSPPTFTDIVFDYHSDKLKTFDSMMISQEEISGWKIVRFLLYLALAIIPTTTTNLFNGAMFFAWSSTCSGYFLCVYSWDHWYHFSYLLGLLRFYLAGYFDPHLVSTWLITSFLFFSICFVVVAPFFFASVIVKLTVVCNLFYGAFVSGISLFLLRIHYAPDY